MDADVKPNGHGLEKTGLRLPRRIISPTVNDEEDDLQPDMLEVAVVLCLGHTTLVDQADLAEQGVTHILGSFGRTRGPGSLSSLVLSLTGRLESGQRFSMGRSRLPWS